jgi:uncharacterized protein (TIGR01777 family)
METILISGGSGLIGSHLIKMLIDKGFNVTLLSRKVFNKSDVKVFLWDPDREVIDTEAITGADYIIHLAGTGIGEGRWTKKRRREIINSRVKTANLVFRSIKDNKNKLKAFISASATGYYGTVTSDKIFDETDPPSGDFLSETCRQWEESADRFEELGIRTVKVRTGIVLTRKGGALSKMIIPVKMGIGSPTGKGSQYVPWIHIEDLCNIYIKTLEDINLRGAYNAVAPDHRSNMEFNRALARTLGKPFWFPAVPAIVLKIMFGRMSSVILEGSRVSSDKIREAGYNFHFPVLENALADLFND